MIWHLSLFRRAARVLLRDAPRQSVECAAALHPDGQAGEGIASEPGSGRAAASGAANGSKYHPHAPSPAAPTPPRSVVERVAQYTGERR